MEGFQRATLDVIELVPGVMSVYNDIDLLRNQVTGASRPAFEDMERQQQIFDTYMHEHPVIAHMSQTGDTSPLAISDCVDFAEFKQRDLYRKFFAPLGIVDQIAVGLPSSPEFVTGIAISRATFGFDQRVRAILRLLAPSLGSSYFAARARSAVAEHLSSKPSIGSSRSDLITLDEHGAITSLVGDAAALVRHYFDFELTVGGELPVEVKALSSEEVGGASELGRTPADVPSRLSTRGGDHLRGRSIAGLVPGVARIVILIEDPERVGAERAANLGLSERERMVANQLARAHSIDEIALTLIISRHTVKRHLERIYARLGVGSRAEAIVRLLDLS